MFHALETDRLLLKNISLDDTGFIFSEFSDDDVNEFLYDEEPMTDEKEAVDLINFYTCPEPREQHRWILIRKSDHVKIGTCGFHCWDRVHSAIEIGYDMKKPYWGNGYMQEAVSAMIHFAKEDLKIKTLKAHIYEHNIRSMCLAEKQGFIFSGETIVYNFRGEEYLHKIYIKLLI